MEKTNPEDVKIRKMWDDYNSLKDKTDELLECYAQKYMENDDKAADQCKTRFVKKYGKRNWHYY